jgi:hypothetical protein
MTKSKVSIKKKLSSKDIKRSSSISRLHLLVVALVFAAIGAYILYVSFAAPNPSLPGDLNNDNTVNITDLSVLLSNYGSTNAAADINGDGTVSILDLSILLSNYGKSVTTGDTTPPTVSLSAPASGATVSGSSVSLAATASDNVAVTKVEFYVDSTLVNSDTTSPYAYTWNSTTVANGAHTIQAKAYDAAGNNANKSVSVTVSNVVSPPPPPSGGGTVLWGTNFEDAPVGETISATSGTPSLSGKYLGRYFSSIEHDYDSTSLCKATIMGDGGVTGQKYMRIYGGAPKPVNSTRGRCQPQANLSPKTAPGQDLYYGIAIRLSKVTWSMVQDNGNYFLDTGYGFRYTCKNVNGPGNGVGKNFAAGTDLKGVRHSQPYWEQGTNLAGTVGAADTGAVFFNLDGSNPDGSSPTGTLTSWHTIVIHVKWSQSSSGLRETWYDGKKVGTYSGATMGTQCSTANYRVGGIYEGSEITEDRWVDTDNMRVGTTYSAADPSK